METFDRNARLLFIGTFYKNNKQIGKEKITQIFIKDKELILILRNEFEFCFLIETKEKLL
jgi:hypothetical protein